MSDILEITINNEYYWLDYDEWKALKELLDIYGEDLDVEMLDSELKKSVPKYRTGKIGIDGRYRNR